MITTAIEGVNGVTAIIKSEGKGFYVTISGADISPHRKKLTYVTDFDTAKKWAKTVLRLIANDQSEVAVLDQQLIQHTQYTQKPVGDDVAAAAC